MAHHQQFLDWIENELINQNLHLGDELPDDRVLAREVGLSQNLMRESLKHCEEIGVLRLYEGRKKSIISVLLREPASSAGPAIGLYLASSRAPRQDLLNTCLLLESYALAGPSFDQSAFPELDRIVGAMQDAATSLSDFHDLEADFHIQLGRLSGNALVSALLATLRDAMIEARFELVNRVPLWSATSARLRMEYRAIVDAARSGDPALAQTLLRANLHERFAEAGHRLDLPEDMGQEDEDPQFTLEPVDIDAKGLLPEQWGGAIEPDLFEALATIQPIKSSVSPARSVLEKSKEQPAPEPVTASHVQTAPEAPLEEAPVEDAPEVAEAVTAQEVLTDATPQASKDTAEAESAQALVEPKGQEPAERSEKEPQAKAAETPEPDLVLDSEEEKSREPAVSEQPDQQPERPEPIALAEERAVPTGSATRKRRGTVSPVVRATVIPPRQTSPKPVPVRRLIDWQPVGQEDKPLVVTEQVSAPVQRVPVEDLEEKLKNEEARLAAAKKLARRTETNPRESGAAPARETGQVAHAPEAQVMESPAPAREIAASEPKRPSRVASKKLFDIVNYFGFKQMKSPVRSAVPAEHSRDVDDTLHIPDEPETNSFEGYEYIDPLAEDDGAADYSDWEDEDLHKSAPWQDETSQVKNGQAEQPLPAQTGQPTEPGTAASAGSILSQKKGKKKSKKNRR
ncbi:FCD domain-containing protein [Rothia sp. P5766]|uniref:FadR/GntR family transcriptional regulator n=1 Tax=Rothia sp. P5766 TaxID=3402656 RepID=UPI003AEEA966